MSSATIYNEIIVNIRKLYEMYEERANQMAEDKREKMGTKIDKQENTFITKLTLQEKSMTELTEEMKKYQKGAVNQYKQNMNLIKDCLADLRIILKKKSLNFKINKYIIGLVEDTDASMLAIRKDLATYGETKFCCCGTDGAKRFKTPMNLFKIVAGKWKMVTNFQSKDSIQNFISPKFSEPEYNFIAQILRKRWPESKVIQVQKEVVKQVVKQVVKYVGNKPSILQTANQYVYGINREQNPAYGLDIYIEEADKNSNPIACTFLGKIYEDGTLLGRDLKKAVSYYQKAMSNKQAYASYRFAMLLIKGSLNRAGQTKEDIEKGYNILNQITTGQNPCAEALCQLGEIHEYGSFQQDQQQLFKIKKDLPKSMGYYTKAKNLHLPRASNNLGVLYLNNKQMASAEAIQGSYEKKIMDYLQQAQIQGFGQAYYNLGVIYSKGLLGQKNSDLALKMFYEGSLKNDYKCKIKFAYELMNQTSIMKQQYQDHYQLAIKWLESVVHKLSITEDHSVSSSVEILQKDKAEAMFYLGIIYEHGFGADKSPKKAFNYFIQSADLDYPAAKNKIGDCYFSGYGIKQDRQLAVGCYIQASELGNSDAMVNLGTIYLNGIPGMVQRNYNKAQQYFSDAIQLENTDAMIHMSYIYRNGLGVQNNEEFAKDLLEKAAENKNATALYMLKEQGSEFNERVLFQHLQNQFFTAPKKIRFEGNHSSNISSEAEKMI